MLIARSAEADAFLDTMDAADPTALSACAGWTAHDVAAHVTGIAVEVNRHLKPYLHGDAVPATRSFEEREAPLRELGHADLLRRLDATEVQMRGLVADVLEHEELGVIRWTGRPMAVAKFIPHLRNEHALHRWDVAGDDAVSRRLLGNPELVEHSVAELGEILLRAGRKHDPEPDAEFGVTLRSPGEPDLLVRVHDGTARLTWTTDADGDGDADSETDGGGGDGGDPELTLELSAADRHVFIWGRRPDRHSCARSQMPQPELARLQSLLSGY